MSYYRPLLTCTFDGHMTERAARYIIRLWSQQCKLSATSVRRVCGEVLCGHFMKPSQILLRYEDAIFHLAEARSLYVLGSVLQHKPEHLITFVSLMIFDECPTWLHMGHLLYLSVLIYWLQERSIGTESPLYGTACERLARPHGSFDRMFGNEDTKIPEKACNVHQCFLFSKKNINDLIISHQCTAIKLCDVWCLEPWVHVPSSRALVHAGRHQEAFEAAVEAFMVIALQAQIWTERDAEDWYQLGSARSPKAKINSAGYPGGWRHLDSSSSHGCMFHHRSCFMFQRDVRMQCTQHLCLSCWGSCGLEERWTRSIDDLLGQGRTCSRWWAMLCTYCDVLCMYTHIYNHI